MVIVYDGCAIVSVFPFLQLTYLCFFLFIVIIYRFRQLSLKLALTRVGFEPMTLSTMVQLIIPLRHRFLYQPSLLGIYTCYTSSH